MEFVRSLKGYDHLWAVRFPEKETDELTLLFRRWGDINYLLDFLGTIWKTMELTREKARNWNRERHASWLRVYAIRLEKTVFVITGGAIKLTQTMQERPHTWEELKKMDRCREFLKTNGIFDQDSLIDYANEESYEKQGHPVPGTEPE